MKLLNKYCVSLLLLCVVLANNVGPTESIAVGEIVKEVMPWMIGPVQRVVSSSLRLMGYSTDYFREREIKDVNLINGVLLESQLKMADSVKNVDAYLLETIEKVFKDTKSEEFMEKLYNVIDEMQKGNSNNIRVIMNSKITGIPKQATMLAMLDYHSRFRTIVRSFVNKFIKASGFLSAQNELLYEIILEKEQLLANLGNVGLSESTHSKIFKIYMYILKVLTDAYAMIITAHTVQYQNEVNSNNLIEANEIQKLSLELLDQYKSDMKEFMDKTKWALDLAPRDIRNSVNFELKRGETFERLSFANIFPKINDWDLIPPVNTMFAMHYGPIFSCHSRASDVNIDNYEIGKCTDGGLERPSNIKVFVNLTNTDWPYMYLINKPFSEPEQVMGHHISGPGLTKRKYETNSIWKCFPQFCSAFKKNSLAFSTQIVRAKPGNVITGIRLKVGEGVISIEIQEGKFVDEVRVDPKTVTWTETPKSSELLYMNSKLRKLELGAVEVPENQFLTAIQFKLINEIEGIVGLAVAGSSPDNNWVTSDSDLKGSSDLISKSNELVLSEPDSPEVIGADVKNLISKAPVESESYYVTFQSSDFVKDLGRTTVPYIDIRGVESNPPSPLGGVKLYHQTSKDSGGFVSLAAVTPNFSKYMDINGMEEVIDTSIIA